VELNGVADFYWCNNNNGIQGVAILIKPLLTIPVKNVEKDDKGLYTSLELLCANEKVYLLTNVYAPNNGTKLKDFFNSLSSKLMD
jgi:exonuclease III